MNYASFWALAGAASCVERAAAAAVEGQNVLVLLPATFPGGFLEELKKRLRSLELQFLSVQAIAGRLPAQQVGRAILQQEVEGVPEMKTLLEDPGAAGLAVIIMGVDCGDWILWRAFLGEWQQETAKMPAQRRPRLIAILTGAGFEPGVPASIATEIVRLDNLGETDVVSWAEANMRGNGMSLPRLQWRIVRATLAEVAQWDPVTLADLAKETPFTILEPHAWLKAHAQGRGWSADTPKSRGLGTVGLLDSQKGTHIALQMVQNEKEGLAELEQRLWRAQTSILLSWVEDRRGELIERYGRILEGLKRPDDAVEELEIGAIRKLLNWANIPERDKERSTFAKDVRNNLSHRSRVPAWAVLDLPKWD